MRWEYKVETLSRYPEKELNKLGAEGWELVAVMPSAEWGQSGVFKRAVSPGYKLMVTNDPEACLSDAFERLKALP